MNGLISELEAMSLEATSVSKIHDNIKQIMHEKHLEEEERRKQQQLAMLEAKKKKQEKNAKGKNNKNNGKKGGKQAGKQGGKAIKKRINLFGLNN